MPVAGEPSSLGGRCLVIAINMAALAPMYMIVSITVILHGAGGAPLTRDYAENTIYDMVSEENDIDSLSLVEDVLFEGDIMISEDLIRKYYNLSSIPGGEEYHVLMPIDEDNTDDNDIMESKEEKHKLEKRGAVGNESMLWPDAEVPYQFSSNLSSGLRLLIRRAMDHWEDRTCLRFTAYNGESDFVECISTINTCVAHIGKIGGRQVININSVCSFEAAVHEIGHAVGFWHEQSRPDRDNYVRINESNVMTGQKHNFMKLTNTEINSRGYEYDYGSIMHYPETAFVRENCTGCKTIEITNITAYIKQGLPVIGQSKGLSRGDIQQANILYSCPKRGEKGVLIVHIKSGESLPNTDSILGLGKPDPYVKVIAVDSSGVKHNQYTSIKSDDTLPDWNEYLILPELEWQFFRIQIWDVDLDSFLSDEMSISETILITSGEHSGLKHYSRLDSYTSGFVSFDYSLYQPTPATLTVRVKYASNLQDTDPAFNSPDPYVTVTAISSTGPQSLSTLYVYGTQNPTWNTAMNFGCQNWVKQIFLQVWDEDNSYIQFDSDDAMSTLEMKEIELGSHQNNNHSAYGSGILVYDYSFVLDGNDCSPNPCQNGGICVDGCASYTCQCPSNYTGTNCEHFSGNLQVWAGYARNLPVTWYNDCDPYMEIIATDVDGNSITKYTSYFQSNLNPDWNEWVYFGKGSWKLIKVRVYDFDYYTSDALSDQYVWNVAYGSHANQAFYCYSSGYAVFDYYFY